MREAARLRVEDERGVFHPTTFHKFKQAGIKLVFEAALEIREPLVGHAVPPGQQHNIGEMDTRFIPGEQLLVFLRQLAVDDGDHAAEFASI